MSHPRSADNAPPPPPPPPPPRRDPSVILFVAGLVPIALSAAATVTSIWGTDPVVSRTAWVVVAVVGTSTMISAAVCIRPRPVPPHQPIEEERKS